MDYSQREEVSVDLVQLSSKNIKLFHILHVFFICGVANNADITHCMYHTCLLVWLKKRGKG